MKRTFLLIAAVLALTMSATAQQQINFADMPLVNTPAPMPLNYDMLNWGNFMYVDPGQYAGGGPGYRNFFTHRDVVFIGGQQCGPVRPGCYGIISRQGIHGGFEAVSAIMAAGYRPQQVTVLAYNEGRFVGSYSFILRTMPQLVTFPDSWTTITEMQIKSDAPGNLVLFDLSFYIVM